MWNLCNCWYVCFVWPLEYLIKKPPVPRKRATLGLITVKSCSALLHILLVCICSYLKSFLRYKYLILDTSHPDTLSVREQGCGDMWLFFKTGSGPQAKKCGKRCPVHLPNYFVIWQQFPSLTILTTGPTSDSFNRSHMWQFRQAGLWSHISSSKSQIWPCWHQVQVTWPISDNSNNRFQILQFQWQVQSLTVVNSRFQVWQF
jgi:hypothetical protein